jgi:hypothetical protein
LGDTRHEEKEDRKVREMGDGNRLEDGEMIRQRNEEIETWGGRIM